MSSAAERDINPVGQPQGPKIPFRVNLSGASDSILELDILGLSSEARDGFVGIGATQVVDVMRWYLNMKGSGVVNVQVRGTYREVERRLDDFKERLRNKLIIQKSHGDYSGVVVFTAEDLLINPEEHKEEEQRKEGKQRKTTGKDKKPRLSRKEDEEERAELISLHHINGLAPKEIAAIQGVHTKTVLKKLRRHKIEVRDYGKRLMYKLLGEDPKGELTRLYIDEDLGPTAIANRLGEDVSSKLVHSWLDLFGLEEIKMQRIIGDNPRAIIRQLVDSGLTDADLAGRFGLNKMTAYRWVRKAFEEKPKGEEPDV